MDQVILQHLRSFRSIKNFVKISYVDPKNFYKEVDPKNTWLTLGGERMFLKNYVVQYTLINGYEEGFGGKLLRSRMFFGFFSEGMRQGEWISTPSRTGEVEWISTLSRTGEVEWISTPSRTGEVEVTTFRDDEEVQESEEEVEF